MPTLPPVTASARPSDLSFRLALGIRSGQMPGVGDSDCRCTIASTSHVLPGRVYDPRTAAEGGTNADDVTDALRNLRVAPWV